MGGGCLRPIGCVHIPILLPFVAHLVLCPQDTVSGVSLSSPYIQYLQRRSFIMADDVPLDVDEDIPMTPSIGSPVRSRKPRSGLTSTSIPFVTLMSRFSPDGTTRTTLAENANGDEDHELTQKAALTGPKIPLYKRRWFITMNIVVALISIVVLFVLLYPVTHAIAQRIVNAAVLNVDDVFLTNPTNNS